MSRHNRERRLLRKLSREGDFTLFEREFERVPKEGGIAFHVRSGASTIQGDRTTRLVSLAAGTLFLLGGATAAILWSQSANGPGTAHRFTRVSDHGPGRAFALRLAEALNVPMNDRSPPGDYSTPTQRARWNRRMGITI